MINLFDPDLIMRLRDHFVNDTLPGGVEGRAGFGHKRTRVVDVLDYDSDTGNILPGGGQGDLQCATFWPPDNPKDVNKPGTDPSKNSDQTESERFGGYAFSWPTYQEAAVNGEGGEKHLQNTTKLYGRLRPIRNMDLDTDKMYKLGRIVGFLDDPNPPVNGTGFLPGPPPGATVPTQPTPTTTQPRGGATTVSVAPPGGTVQSPTNSSVGPQGGSGSGSGGRVSTVPRGGSTSGNPTPGKIRTFAGYMGQKKLGQELPDNRMASSPLPGKWPMIAVAGSEKDGHHPIVLPANINVLISDYMSRNDFVEENIFSTRLVDLKRDDKEKVLIDKSRISTLSSCLRVAGMVDQTGRSSALAWNVPPGVPLAGRGQFFDSGLLGSPFLEFSGGEAQEDPDPATQSTQGGQRLSKNKGNSGYNSNPSNVPSGVLNNSNVGGGLAGLVAGAGGPNVVQPAGGSINGLAGFGGGNPTPCTTIDPGQSKTTCGTEPGKDGTPGGALRDISIGYAGISGGGPISAGASIDRHLIGTDQDGRVHNQGHVHGFAPHHYGPQFCAPNFHEGEWEAAQDSSGVYVPVRYCHDSEKLHRKAGNKFGGGVAVGLQRWQVKVPFYLPPIVYPPWIPEDWFPPINPEPKGGDPDQDSVPTGPKKLIDWFEANKKIIKRNFGFVAPAIEPPWTRRNSVPFGRKTPVPAGDFAGLHTAIDAIEGARQPNHGVATGQVRGRKLLRGLPIVKEKEISNQREYIRHWMEESFTTILATPSSPHNKDLKFERNPNEADLNAIECMPVSGRLEAWGAYITDRKPELHPTGFEKSRYASGTPTGGGFNWTPGTEGCDNRSGVSEKPKCYFNFQDSILSFGKVNKKGPNRGRVTEAFLDYQPNNTTMVRAYSDASATEVEHFSWNSEGDFSATRKMTAQAFIHATRVVGFGNTVAVIGDSIGVQTASGASTVQLPDPTLTPGARVTVYDLDGSATANPIVVLPTVGTIDGGVTSTINSPRGAREFEADGTNWKILNDYLGTATPTVGTVITTTQNESGNFNAAYGTSHQVDLSGGSYTATLPAITAADHGKVIEIADSGGNASTNNLIIDTTGGAKILGVSGVAAASMIQDYDAVSLRAVVQGLNLYWVVN